MRIETTSNEEAKKLRNVLKPDDVPVEGLEYSAKVESNDVVYKFKSDCALKVRNAADEVLEHASLVEAIKGLSEPRKGVTKSVREEKGRN